MDRKTSHLVLQYIYMNVKNIDKKLSRKLLDRIEVTDGLQVRNDLVFMNNLVG
jgi:hypothetical protein